MNGDALDYRLTRDGEGMVLTDVIQQLIQCFSVSPRQFVAHKLTEGQNDRNDSSGQLARGANHVEHMRHISLVNIQQFVRVVGAGCFRVFLVDGASADRVTTLKDANGEVLIATLHVVVAEPKASTHHLAGTRHCLDAAVVGGVTIQPVPV